MNNPMKPDPDAKEEDYCEECGECYCVCMTERELQAAKEARKLADAMPNNRPQDGRVCDCEDAPCCGHYEL